jgi:hypothetical protein
MNQYKSSCLLHATVIFLKQRGNRINLLVLFTKYRQLGRQVGDSHALSVVEKEVMAPHTIGGLAGGMARSGHIHRENNRFIGVKGLAPTSTFSRSLDLHLRNLAPVVHGRHTPRTTLGGYISEYTYLEGTVPSLIVGRGQVSCLVN